MGEKRHNDDAGPSANKRHKGAHRQHPDFKKNTPRPESSNWAKKRVRTIERRLRNPDGLPGHVQVEMRRELAALNDQLEGKNEKKQRAAMISKYHMIRFFERKKAERLQKQLTRRLRETNDADERTEIEADLAVAEIDNLYARFYPFMEAYVSLYPKGKGEGEGEGEKGDGGKDEDEKDNDKKYGKSSAAAALRSPRPAMWELIKKTSADGAKALEKLRDRPASGSQAPTGEDIGEIAAAKEKTKEKAKGKKEKEKGKEKKVKEKKEKKEKTKDTKKDKTEEESDADEAEAETEAKGVDVAMADDSDEGGFFE